MSERLPPYSTEAETGVLGCVMMDPVVLDEAITAGVANQWFYDSRHQDIWAAIVGLHDARSPIDIITLYDRLRSQNLLEACGGSSYISSMIDSVPCAQNISHYIGILRDKFRLRALLAAARKAADSVLSGADPDPILDQAEIDILSIRREHSTQEDATGKKLARAAFDLLVEKTSGRSDACSTGFRNLDKILKGGLRPGRVFVVAGRPGAGKTAFALSMLALIASRGDAVGFISLEMDREEIGMRLLSMESGVDVTMFDDTRQPNEGEQRSITIGTSKLAKMAIHVNDTPKTTPQGIAARARRWVKKFNIKVLAVDYLQLIESRQGRERREQIEAISREMKLLAKELKIPIVLLSQLNREIEKDKGRIPRLADLRESGAIEQDADIVGILYIDNGKKGSSETAQDGSPIDVKLRIAKQRGGIADVDVAFTFERHLTRFIPWSHSQI